MDTINDQISKNLKQLRREKGLTLDDLAEISDVSKSMLSEIERGGTNPTILVLWKIAEGMKIPLTSLVTPPESEYTIVRAADRSMLIESPDHLIQTIIPYSDKTRAETLTIIIKPKGRLSNRGHLNGVEEVVILTHGMVHLELGEQSMDLHEGDAIRFDGTLPHEFSNTADSPVEMVNIIFYK